MPNYPQACTVSESTTVTKLANVASFKNFANSTNGFNLKGVGATRLLPYISSPNVLKQIASSFRVTGQSITNPLFSINIGKILLDAYTATPSLKQIFSYLRTLSQAYTGYILSTITYKPVKYVLGLMQNYTGYLPSLLHTTPYHVLLNQIYSAVSPLVERGSNITYFGFSRAKCSLAKSLDLAWTTLVGYSATNPFINIARNMTISLSQAGTIIFNRALAIVSKCNETTTGIINFTWNKLFSINYSSFVSKTLLTLQLSRLMNISYKNYILPFTIKIQPILTVASSTISTSTLLKTFEQIVKYSSSTVSSLLLRFDKVLETASNSELYIQTAITKVLKQLYISFTISINIASNIAQKFVLVCKYTSAGIACLTAQATIIQKLTQVCKFAANSVAGLSLTSKIAQKYQQVCNYVSAGLASISFNTAIRKAFTVSSSVITQGIANCYKDLRTNITYVETTQIIEFVHTLALSFKLSSATTAKLTNLIQRSLFVSEIMLPSIHFAQILSLMLETSAKSVIVCGKGLYQTLITSTSSLLGMLRNWGGPK